MVRVEAVRRELAVASSVVRLVLVRAEDQPLDAARNAAVWVGDERVHFVLLDVCAVVVAALLEKS